MPSLSNIKQNAYQMYRLGKSMDRIINYVREEFGGSPEVINGILKEHFANNLEKHHEEALFINETMYKEKPPDEILSELKYEILSLSERFDRIQFMMNKLQAGVNRTKICQVCGKSFEPKRKDAVFCGKTCAKRNARSALGTTENA